MTEYQILQALRKKYDSNAYVVIPQVRNQTGFSRTTRTADAIAVSLWPSRGIGVEGFEFKDSRTDWQKELKQPEKAEEISRYCERWWIVASKPGIVLDGELPKTWGLIEIVDEMPKVKVKAPVLEPQAPSWPFIASLLRSASKSIVPEEDVKREVEKARADAWKEMESKLEILSNQKMRHFKDQYEKLRKLVHDFEEASGFRFDQWNPNGAKVGAVMKLLASQYGGLRDSLASIRGTLAANLQLIDDAISAVPVVEANPNEKPVSV
jgi:hypothetical protein